MTSEELNRTIEFINQTQTRIAVNMEDLQRVQRRDREWAKRLLRRIDADLQDHAVRIKWWEDFSREEQEWRRIFEQAMQRRDDEAQRRDDESQRRHEEILARLDRILDKLSGRWN